MQMSSTPVKVKEKVESRLMSEMRQHLVEMNRKKMLDRGLISERELAIIGQLTLNKDVRGCWYAPSYDNGKITL